MKGNTQRTTHNASFNLLLAMALLLVPALACGYAATPTSTPLPVLADSFFFGRAYVDANGNGQHDEADPPLKGAFFTATDVRGASGGDHTDDSGRAIAWWPAGSEYPVTLRMSPPEGEGYTLIGPAEVVLQQGEGNSAEFLFAPPASPANAFDESAFWDTFPLPDDAEIMPVVEGMDIGFATGLTEPGYLTFTPTGCKTQVGSNRPPPKRWSRCPIKSGARMGPNSSSRFSAWTNRAVPSSGCT